MPKYDKDTPLTFDSTGQAQEWLQDTNNKGIATSSEYGIIIVARDSEGNTWTYTAPWGMMKLVNWPKELHQ